MKTMNLKSKLGLFASSLSAACALCTAPATLRADAPQPPNPFSRGTAPAHLTAEQIQHLLRFVNQSQVRLQQALDEGKEQELDEEAQTYLDAVKEVVIASDHERPGSELLMRIILNQTLALTYGVPAPDGQGIETEGVLVRSSYADLLPSILRSSIQTALSFAKRDVEAIQKGALLDLPYAEVAQLRLQWARQWLRSVLELDRSARFGLAALQLWLNTMVEEAPALQEKHAEAITLVTRVLKQADRIALSGKPLDIVQGEQARLARITISDAIEKMRVALMPPKATPPATSEAGQAARENPSILRFVRIEPGRFVMGSPESERGRQSDERQHSVTLNRGFDIQTTLTNQAQFSGVMGYNPSQHQGDPNLPVDNVSFDDVQLFLWRFNQLQNPQLKCSTFEEARTTSGCYRLPTEAEWEYAARAGSQSAYSFGDEPGQLRPYGWFFDNSGKASHPVATRIPNAYGLFDMHGNLWQWVQDWYGEYPRQAVTDPVGSSGDRKVARGGSYYEDASSARSAARGSFHPASRGGGMGFRVARTL